MRINQKYVSSVLAFAAAGLIITVGCTKGMTQGGTEAEPAAVETAGVPPMPHHGEEKTAEGHTSPASEHGAPTEPHSSSQHVAPATPTVQPSPAGGPSTSTHAPQHEKSTTTAH